MFNKSERAESFEGDAEARFGALIQAFETEERLMGALRKALDDPGDEAEPGMSELIEAVEQARRSSAEALERWREAIRVEPKP